MGSLNSLKRVCCLLLGVSIILCSCDGSPKKVPLDKMQKHIPMYPGVSFKELPTAVADKVDQYYPLLGVKAELKTIASGQSSDAARKVLDFYKEQFNARGWKSSGVAVNNEEFFESEGGGSPNAVLSRMKEDLGVNLFVSGKPDAGPTMIIVVLGPTYEATQE